MSKKVALVTGGSRGIGRAIVQNLLAADFQVAFTATRAETITSVQSELEASFPEDACGFVYKAGSENAEIELVKNVIAKFGKIDSLVNNAGIHDDNLMMRMKDDQWQQVIKTNLEAPFYLSRAVLRPMLKQKKGSILFISSVVGLMGNSGQANYAAAKSGLMGLAKTIAKEYGSKGITSNVIAPGFIETDMIDELPQDYLKQIIDQIPANRLGKAEEIASLVNYLLSPLAAYITGQVIQVDGGIRM